LPLNGNTKQVTTPTGTKAVAGTKSAASLPLNGNTNKQARPRWLNNLALKGKKTVGKQQSDTSKSSSSGSSSSKGVRGHRPSNTGGSELNGQRSRSGSPGTVANTEFILKQLSAAAKAASNGMRAASKDNQLTRAATAATMVASAAVMAAGALKATHTGPSDRNNAKEKVKAATKALEGILQQQKKAIKTEPPERNNAKEGTKAVQRINRPTTTAGRRERSELSRKRKELREASQETSDATNQMAKLARVTTPTGTKAVGTKSAVAVPLNGKTNKQVKVEKETKAVATKSAALVPSTGKTKKQVTVPTGTKSAALMPLNGKTNKQAKLAKVTAPTGTKAAAGTKLAASLPLDGNTNKQARPDRPPETAEKEAKRVARIQKLHKVPKKRVNTVREMANAVENLQDAGNATAESRAAWILEQNAKNGRKISDRDLAGVLEVWSFKENKKRTNVMPEGKSSVNSEMLGLVRIRAFSTYCAAAKTKMYPLVTKLLCRFLEENPPKGLNRRMKFPFTTVCINRDYAAKRHRDSNNMGVSVVRAFGNFAGGRLRYFPEDTGGGNVEDLDSSKSVVLDVKHRSVVVDSTKAHEVEPFKGRRYSLVYFTIPSWYKCSEEAKQWLTRECDVPLPRNMPKAQETWRVAMGEHSRRSFTPPWEKEPQREKEKSRDRKGERERAKQKEQEAAKENEKEREREPVGCQLNQSIAGR